jgi:CheY-like chemotaxis protein
MPGLSGPELLRVLRLDERWRRIPVVVMTGNNDTALPIRLDVPVVYKPDTDGLVAMIQHLRPSS